MQSAWTTETSANSLHTLATKSRALRGQKIERFGGPILYIDDGRAFIPNEAPGLERFLYEVGAFPNIADKDQVDSMTQLIGNWDNALRFARQNKSNEAYLRP